MKIFFDDIYPIVKEAFLALGIKENVLSQLLAPATNEGRADLALPCHSLSKVLKITPVEVSLQLKKEMPIRINEIAEISCMNGFVNFRAHNTWIQQKLHIIYPNPRLGIKLVSPKRYVVDYSAPNVAKEMHVGHLRSTVIGDSIVRMLSFKGHIVIRENHIGDWGTPFGMLIEHLLDMGEAEAANELNVGDLDGFYKQARSKFNLSEEFANRARKRVVSLQSGDIETMRLWKILVSESMRYFNDVYSMLNVLLVDDDIRGESSYHDLLPIVMNRLTKSKLLVKSDGAEVVYPKKKWLNRQGEEMPMIIRKGDGGYNYSATDLACIIDRTERLSCTEFIYVVGTPQKQHFDMVFDIAKLAKLMDGRHTATHVNFGSVLGPNGKILKSREGNVIKLVDLLKEAILRAEKTIMEKNPQLTGEDRKKVAKMIGIGAIKYADLSTERTKDYIFDWEKMLSFDGNTAPYLQYAHARICSIFSKSEKPLLSSDDFKFLIIEKEEQLLSRRLLIFSSKLNDSIESFSPHKLCIYLHSLASSFASFYENCPVLKSPNEDIMNSRLALCELTARTLNLGMSLLGIASPEEM